MSRHRFDHAAAKALYISLDPPGRTYAEVSRRVGVSETTIRRVARQERWEEAAAAAGRRTVARAVRTREERIRVVLDLVDGVIDHYKANLEAKAGEADWGDVERLVKLSELLLGEATDRISLAEAQALYNELMARAAARMAPPDRKAFLKEIREHASELGTGDQP